ncbi:MAG: Aspartate racemase [Brockia lithotrophica]|uniref:Aspartate racemase n=1 Tax=Brockia lithotrophica TaxID=933949 RepID=A0A2T5G3Z3_9BACL|nr:MAG: Aspartate racemase [Brockia lithotrophica]
MHARPRESTLKTASDFPGVERGTEGIILGCTEIGLLLPDANDLSVPAFDTTLIHAQAAVGWFLS